MTKEAIIIRQSCITFIDKFLHVFFDLNYYTIVFIISELCKKFLKQNCRFVSREKHAVSKRIETEYCLILRCETEQQVRVQNNYGTRRGFFAMYIKFMFLGTQCRGIITLSGVYCEY